GQQVLGAAGYTPEALGQMLALLQQANRLNDDGSFAYLRSHPLGTERVAEAGARVAGLQAPGGWAVVSMLALPSAAWHPWMQARAEVAISDNPAQWQAWQQQGERATAPLNEAAQVQAWRAALAAAKGQQVAVAWGLLAKLAAALPTGSAQADAVLGLQLRLWAQAPARLPQVAQQQVQAMVQRALAGAHRALWLDATEAALRVGMAREVVAVLRPWLSAHPADPLVWAAMARAQAALDLPLAALRAQAELQWARGQGQQALERLDAAQRLLPKAARREPHEADVVLARRAAMAQAWAQQQAQ
ncbi:MAG: hypothetical protein VW518_01430, partial [Burkholderiaceae bacterium]